MWINLRVNISKKVRCSTSLIVNISNKLDVLTFKYFIYEQILTSTLLHAAFYINFLAPESESQSHNLIGWLLRLFVLAHNCLHILSCSKSNRKRIWQQDYCIILRRYLELTRLQRIPQMTIKKSSVNHHLSQHWTKIWKQKHMTASRQTYFYTFSKCTYKLSLLFLKTGFVISVKNDKALSFGRMHHVWYICVTV